MQSLREVVLFFQIKYYVFYGNPYCINLLRPKFDNNIKYQKIHHQDGRTTKNNCKEPKN